MQPLYCHALPLGLFVDPAVLIKNVPGGGPRRSSFMILEVGVGQQGKALLCDRFFEENILEL